MVTPAARSKDQSPDTAQLFTLFSKLLTGLISLSVTVSLGLAAFSLRETYQAQLNIRELQTKLIALQVDADKRDAKVAANTTAVYKIQVLEQNISTMQEDLRSIKLDIRQLLNQK